MFILLRTRPNYRFARRICAACSPHHTVVITAGAPHDAVVIRRAPHHARAPDHARAPYDAIVVNIHALHGPWAETVSAAARRTPHDIPGVAVCAVPLLPCRLLAVTSARRTDDPPSDRLPVGRRVRSPYDIAGPRIRIRGESSTGDHPVSPQQLHAPIGWRHVHVRRIGECGGEIHRTMCIDKACAFAQRVVAWIDLCG